MKISIKKGKPCKGSKISDTYLVISKDEKTIGLYNESGCDVVVLSTVPNKDYSIGETIDYDADEFVKYIGSITLEND